MLALPVTGLRVELVERRDDDEALRGVDETRPPRLAPPELRGCEETVGTYQNQVLTLALAPAVVP